MLLMVYNLVDHQNFLILHAVEISQDCSKMYQFGLAFPKIDQLLKNIKANYPSYNVSDDISRNWTEGNMVLTPVMYILRPWQYDYHWKDNFSYLL